MEAVKKYDLKEINIRLNNLKKILGDMTVEKEINFQSRYSDNWRDVLNLAYRILKDRYTKIQRYKYGFIRPINYEVKKRNKNPYTLYDKITNNSFYGQVVYDYFPLSWSSATYNGTNATYSSNANSYYAW